jgi:UDP-N-acetylglucosamine/UDP-N-acetylgalactosamine diphosphorylase
MVLGRNVSLGSGSFERSILLQGVKLGSSIRVRENCLLEEGCEAGFSVDLKQSFLLACVVLGSEINFCDLLMAGGTGRRDHSEVGSGTIHFNFTPFGASGDKATASLIGDVLHGVFYRSKRIFIGGHASLVGPLKIGFGSVIAAGSRITADVEENTLCFGDDRSRADQKDFDFLRYGSIARKVRTAVEYIAQLSLLWHWYKHARYAASSDPLQEKMLEFALALIASGIEMRVERLDALAGNMKESAARNRSAGQEALAGQQESFLKGWPAAREKLLRYRQVSGNEPAREALCKRIEAVAGSFEGDFPGLIARGLDRSAIDHGKAWLKGITDELTGGIPRLAPSIKRG